MSIEKLIRMANHIASFFRSYPEDQALKGIHDHIVAFWTPGMQRALLSYAGQDDGKLDPLVVKAMVLMPRQGRTRSKRKSPVRRR